MIDFKKKYKVVGKNDMGEINTHPNSTNFHAQKTGVKMPGFRDRNCGTWLNLRGNKERRS